MTIVTHIINNPTPKQKAFFKECERRKIFIQAYWKKHKSIKGLEDALAKRPYKLRSKGLIK